LNRLHVNMPAGKLPSHVHGKAARDKECLCPAMFQHLDNPLGVNRGGEDVIGSGGDEPWRAGTSLHLSNKVRIDAPVLWFSQPEGESGS